MPYANLSGIRLFYQKVGLGVPALVFVHGIACDHTDWDNQFAFFLSKTCVVAPDLRGHGRSESGTGAWTIEKLGADVASLVQQLGLQTVVLVGHSLGCRVVLQAAPEINSRLAGMVLVDGNLAGSDRPDGAEQEAMQKIRAVGYPAVLRQLFAQMFFEGSDPQFRTWIIERALASRHDVGISLLPALYRWDAQCLETFLQAVRVPLLVIQSTTIIPGQGRVALQPGMSVPWLELVQKSVPEAQVACVYGVGHFSMLEIPARICEMLNRFVAHLESGVPE